MFSLFLLFLAARINCAEFALVNDLQDVFLMEQIKILQIDSLENYS